MVYELAIYPCYVCRVTNYSKPFLSLDEQITLLESRGMAIGDHKLARAWLERVGYFRLSGYWYSLYDSKVILDQNGKNTRLVLNKFRPGVEFKHASELYIFDKKLRLLMIDAIERVEVCLRTDVARCLGKVAPDAHRNPIYLNKKFSNQIRYGKNLTNHQEWLNKLDKSASKSKEEFIKIFKKDYSSSHLPIWMAVELWDFGMLSHFLEGMRHSDQMMIAKKYDIERPELLTSWAHSINYVRNVCAHHSRLWNHPLVIQPALPRHDEIPLLSHINGTQSSLTRTRVYAVIALLCYFLRYINPSSNWGGNLKTLAGKFPTAPGAEFWQTGFPPNWSALPLWQQ
jgi:abortive infection bacteriophage resistance protein